jgi:hypothetical protein
MMSAIVFDMQEMAQFRGTQSNTALVSETASGGRLPESTRPSLPALCSLRNSIVPVYVCYTGGHHAQVSNKSFPFAFSEVGILKKINITL